MAWSDPSHWSFRFPYDSLRGAHRAKGGSFLHLFTWRVWRGARGWEWKHWERRAWAPSFMEGARRLRAYLFCGEGSCFVEGALLEERTSLASTSSGWAFADLIGGGLRQHTNRDLHARVSQTTKRRSRAHQFSGRGNKGRGCTCLSSSFLEPSSKAWEELAICAGSIVFAYLLFSMLETSHIYTFILNWFSLGDFIQGHVDQKYLCSNFMYP